MLGKCQWKIFNKGEEGPGIPTADDVVETFLEATRTIPSRRDKRDDPILEPQYKVLSILHKLVNSGHFGVCLFFSCQCVEVTRTSFANCLKA
jgi:hypothetical protein